MDYLLDCLSREHALALIATYMAAIHAVASRG